MTALPCRNEHAESAASFAARLIAWQRRAGRHDLPWQGQDAYRVWVSEIMLQQTQVTTVLPYYRRFIAAFPTVSTLAAASEEQVLAYWSGLGYYARGRNLHRAARHIAERFAGEFPRRFEDIVQLPGVGPSTAAAICALAYHEPRAILDGNVKRVLARWCGIAGWPGSRAVEQRLWRCATALLPDAGGEGVCVAIYTQALMDLGALVCTRSQPRCGVCPVQEDCRAHHTGRVAELPTPRPKRRLPERRTVLLLLRHDDAVLLEKRPRQGIWGGLWSLPQFADEATARDWFLAQGWQAREGRRLPSFSHTFTHFRMHITPLEIELAQQPQLPGALWLACADARETALPAPVRRLLLSLRGSTAPLSPARGERGEEIKRLVASPRPSSRGGGSFSVFSE